MKTIKFADKMNFRSTFSKLIISYALIAILITSILSIVLYNIFLTTSLKVIESNSKGRLSQNINHLNLIRSRTFSLGMQMLNDPEIMKGIYGEDISSVEKGSLARKIYNVINSDSIIHSICLYNAKTLETIDTFTLDDANLLRARMFYILDRYNPNDVLQFIPSKITYKKTNGFDTSENIITVVFLDKVFYYEKSASVTSPFPKTGALFINLNADSIQGSLSSMNEYQEAGTIIVDKMGNAIFDSSKSGFASNIGNRAYISSILKSNKQEGILIQNIQGEKSLIVYKNLATPEWTFISIYKFKDLFIEINKLGMDIVLICIGILIVALLASFISARTIYNPFRLLLNRVQEGLFPYTFEREETQKGKSFNDAQYLTQTFNSIMQKVNELENSIKHDVPMVKKTYLKKLIQGKYRFEPEFMKVFSKLFEEIGNNHDRNCLSVVIFSIDEYTDLIKRQDLVSNDMILSSMEMHIVKIISEFFYCEPIEYENDYIYLLIMVRNEDPINAKVKKIIEKIRRDLEKSLNQKLSCAIGIPVYSIQDVHLSYCNALDMIKYRLVFGYSSFFCYDMEELRVRSSVISIDKSKEKLIQSIKVGDMEQVELNLDNIINDLSQCSYDYIMFTLNQLMLDIVKSTKALYDDDSEEMNFNNIYSNLNTIGTLEDMKVFFTLYLKAAIEKIEKKKLNRKVDMFNDIIVYIRENYYKNDITTESLASMCNLTPGYFGKLFSEIAGKTVNEYILELRLSRAQELLISSNLMSINDISSKIGYSNSTYFITLFKKSVGITPNQFRTENKQSSKG